ncbi:MAG: DNA repair protein RecN [Clostridia bacterium]|nr:DNA repair protein RecN [Clostridia bacterium]
MLCRLAISNIAVIDKAEITLSDGFTVLTGETGAGKSLIIDAITMVLGGRTPRDIIRAGAKCAVAEAAFFGKHPLSDETGMLLLRRELYTDGRNLCSINGQMVTVAGLREAGDTLLSLHGQHDTEKLMHRGSHLPLLDAFAKSEKEREEYGELYKARKELLAEIEKLETDDGEKLKRLDMLSFWIDEIENAAPEVGEDTELEEKREFLRHSEKIRSSAMRAYTALCGEEGSARDFLSEAAKALDAVSSYDARLSSAAEAVRDALYQAEETANILMDIGEEETDGEALEEAESRLDILNKLKSKYGGSIEAVLSQLETLQKERDDIETADERLAACRKALEKTEEKLGKAAKSLSEKRQKAAEKLGKLVMEELAALDMAKVRFSVNITEKEYGETGADQVEFFISTNPMEELKPLSKIASGGELSRICLALQTVLALGAKETPACLIFDEIDTGISGRAAGKVGEKLRALAKSRQVLCVTHLPQIAAKGDHQFRIDKNDTSGSFSTTVTALDAEGRKREIARMISGDDVTEKTLETAEEMLR